MHAIDAPTACENCATPLQGQYCHACGQSIANPIRHAGHAIEELFESFWHLDGRVFRTLRELVRPGQVAIAYLAGHRARYIPPLRLFVILTVLTFFVGRLVVVDSGPAPTVQATAAPQVRSLARATTVAEVRRELAATLAGIDEARAQGGNVPFMTVAMDQAERGAREAAAARIRELGGNEAEQAAAWSAAPSTSATPRATADPAGGPDGDSMGTIVQRVGPDSLRDRSKPWHEQDNPVDVAWLPAFGDRWLNHRLANAERNVRRLREDDSGFGPAVVSQVPTALFVLVPVFALLLKVFYLGSRRLYLEHLVVALYSHAFLLMALLGVFLLTAISGVVGGVVSTVAGWSMAGLFAWAALYLLLMQKRVYAQSWPATVAKYAVLGTAYLCMIVMVLVFAVFAVFFGG